jgi:hypothetical protein
LECFYISCNHSSPQDSQAPPLTVRNGARAQSMASPGQGLFLGTCKIPNDQAKEGKHENNNDPDNLFAC